MKLNEKLIPKGVYCDDCPYWGKMSLYDDIGEITFPYCFYIQTGSVPNGGWDNNEFERLSKLLNLSTDIKNSDNTLFNLLDADLLWDGCKECGVNDDIDEDDLI
jgi:hypothetical protein